MTAAARTAVGAEDSETRVQAASYETAAESDESIWNKTRTKRLFWVGIVFPPAPPTHKQNEKCAAQYVAKTLLL